MENLISKELLSEVLEVNIKEIYKLGSNPNLDKNDLPYSIARCGDIERINIFELVYMNLKEWANSNNVYDEIDWSSDVEAIIKECQSIYEKINK